LLLYTDKRGVFEVPEIFFLILLLIFNLLFNLLNAITVNYYFLPADLPAFLLISSPTNRIPFPLYGSGLRRERILAAT